MSNLIKHIIEVAQKEIGTREIGGNNLGPRVKDYQQATWLAPGPWPWCAAFTCWVLREALLMAKKPTYGICKDASAFGWEKWAKAKGHLVLPETDPCKAGDFVIFDFSHIGVVEEDSSDAWITCIEGNTNGKGERDSEAGDGVWRKRRHRSTVKSFVRVNL